MSKQTSVAEEIRKRSRPCTYLYRAAAAHARAYVDGASPERVAKSLFEDDRVTIWLTRAASDPAMLTTPGWAAELGRQAVFDLVAAATTVSAAADLIARGLRVSLAGYSQITVPGRMVDAEHAGAWVREAGAIPVRMLNFSAVVLEPRKLAVITVFTREMAESSNIEAVVRQTLSEASGLALDAAMFSNAPGDDTRPAGLLNGVTPITPAPAGPDAMTRDLGNLVSALAGNGAGASPAFVAAPAQAFAIKLFAGPHFDVPVLSAPALATAGPSRTVVAIETSSLVTGFDSVPEFNVSRAGTLHMEDDLPRHIVDGAPATPVRSLFQTDSLALKMLLRASWAMRAPHVAWTTNVNWP
jgi:hypothetical protein